MNKKNIKISKPKVQSITTETYKVKVAGFTLTYIDYLNEKGKVIDSIFRDEDGNDLNVDSPGFGDYGVAELIDYIQENLG
tara:strand:+ start:362 stop:601 length:240 start_codon:yes stop_codon:yes gene_type:complete